MCRLEFHLVYFLVHIQGKVEGETCETNLKGFLLHQKHLNNINM